MVKNNNNQPLLHLNSRAAVPGVSHIFHCPRDSFLNQSLFGEEIGGAVGSEGTEMEYLVLSAKSCYLGLFGYFSFQVLPLLDTTRASHYPSIISLSFLPAWSIT